MFPYLSLENRYPPHFLFHDLFITMLFADRLIDDFEDTLIAVIICDKQYTKQLKPVMKNYI
jgi:hypothetical protein